MFAYHWTPDDVFLICDSPAMNLARTVSFHSQASHTTCAPRRCKLLCPRRSTMMYSRSSIIILLVLDVGVAFVSNIPAVGFKNKRTAIAPAGLRTRSYNINRCPTFPTNADEGRGHLQPLSISSADDDADGTPSWRFELDDLLKAASPWGSVVETEIIAMDLLKVQYLEHMTHFTRWNGFVYYYTTVVVPWMFNQFATTSYEYTSTRAWW